MIRLVWFRSSVGLEQQPSKLWVLGSNPNGITQSGMKKPQSSLKVAAFLFINVIITMVKFLSIW